MWRLTESRWRIINCPLCISTFRRAQSFDISQRFSSVMRQKNIPCDLKRQLTTIKIILLTLQTHRNTSYSGLKPLSFHTLKKNHKKWVKAPIEARFLRVRKKLNFTSIRPSFWSVWGHERVEPLNTVKPKNIQDPIHTNTHLQKQNQTECATLTKLIWKQSMQTNKKQLVNSLANDLSYISMTI